MNVSVAIVSIGGGILPVTVDGDAWDWLVAGVHHAHRGGGACPPVERVKAHIDAADVHSHCRWRRQDASDAHNIDVGVVGMGAGVGAEAELEVRYEVPGKVDGGVVPDFLGVLVALEAVFLDPHGAVPEVKGEVLVVPVAIFDEPVEG